MSHASQNPNMLVVFFPQFYSNHHPNTYHYAFLTKKCLRRQVRRKMNGTETEEILKEKSSNKKDRKYLIEHKKWVVTERFQVMCDL